MKYLSIVANKYGAVFLFILSWELISRFEVVNSLFVPPFTVTIKTVGEMLYSGLLVKHIKISLMRALIGFALAVLVGVPLGFLLGGWFRRLKLALELVFEVLSQTNPFLLFHIIILFMGIGEPPKITIIFWTCLWPIMFSTMAGVQSINPNILKAARAFGLGRLSLLYKVVLPATAPSIFTGLRLSLGYSMFMLIAAEMMGASSGLGWLVLQSQENFQITQMFAAVVSIAFIGLLMDYIIFKIEKRFVALADFGELNSGN